MRPHHIDNVLITPRQLARRVDELARELAAGDRSDNLVVIGILRGSFIFLADLVRWFAVHDMHPCIDFMIMESYGHGTTPEKEPVVSRDCTVDLAGADVVVAEMRAAFYPSHTPSFISPGYVLAVSAVCFVLGLVGLHRFVFDLLERR